MTWENTESENLGFQVLDARRKILGVQHPLTILAMETLAITLGSLEKSEEAKNLIIQAQELKNNILLATSHYAIATMANVQEAQKTSIMNFNKESVY